MGSMSGERGYSKKLIGVDKCLKVEVWGYL